MARFGYLPSVCGPIAFTLHCCALIIAANTVINHRAIEETVARQQCSTAAPARLSCYSHVAFPIAAPVITFNAASITLGVLAIFANHPLPAVVAALVVLLGALCVDLYETPCSAVCAFLDCGACFLLDAHMRTTAVLALCFGAACHGVLALSISDTFRKTAA